MALNEQLGLGSKKKKKKKKLVYVRLYSKQAKLKHKFRLN
jgi:hypothetical protein